MNDRPQMAEPRATYRLLAIILLLSLVGAGLAAELTRIHYNTHTNPEFHSICAISEGLNCEAVALSAYSVLLGIPVSMWGLIGYFAILVVGGTAMARRRNGQWDLIFPVAILCAIAFISSAVLAVISFARIDSLCLFCMGTYAVNAALLAVAVPMVRRTGRGAMLLVDNLRALLARPFSTAGLALACALPIPAARFLVTPYWQLTGWDDISILAHGTGDNGVHWMGARHPAVTIMEFTDYECPYCRTAHRALRALLAKHKDRVRIVHRHFPLDDACNPRINRKFHERACEFSLAVECAAQQDRFWEMNDAIFSAQDRVKARDVDLMKFALQLGLDRSDFAECLERRLTSKEIQRDIHAANAAGVRATPSFDVHGQLFTGRLTEEQLATFLKPDSGKPSRPAGTPRD